VIISKSKNFVYVHIEKTGGTSIEKTLLPYLNEEDIIFGGGLPEYKTSSNILWKHSFINDIKGYLGSNLDSMYKFATVRDPVQIMISFYFYIKKNINELLPNKITKVYYDKNLPKEIIVDDSVIYTDDLRNLFFIESIIERSGIDGFIIKMIQSNLREIDPQITKIDYSVELHDLSVIDKQWKYILKNIGIENNIKLLKTNQSNRPDHVQLKKETLQLIYKHFAEDYQTIPQITKVNWPQ
jgi:hypothetical protein